MSPQDWRDFWVIAAVCNLLGIGIGWERGMDWSNALCLWFFVWCSCRALE